MINWAIGYSVSYSVTKGHDPGPGVMLRPVSDPEVEQRNLADYDAALGPGADGGVA